MCFLRFLGHAQSLPVSLPQVPGFLPARNATLLPQSLLKSCKPFQGSARMPTSVPQNRVRPPVFTPTMGICLFLLCIPLAPYLFSGDKFCLVFALSWDVACLSR